MRGRVNDAFQTALMHVRRYLPLDSAIPSSDCQSNADHVVSLMSDHFMHQISLLHDPVHWWHLSPVSHTYASRCYVYSSACIIVYCFHSALFSVAPQIPSNFLCLLILPFMMSLPISRPIALTFSPFFVKHSTFYSFGQLIPAFSHIPRSSYDAAFLPSTAQMNVHVDTLATDYLNNYSEPSKLVPFIPASKASLTINGKISHDDSPNDSEMQLAVRNCARNSWKGTTGSDIPSNPSTGKYQEKPSRLSRTAPILRGEVTRQ